MSYHSVSRRSIAAGMAMMCAWCACSAPSNDGESLPPLAAEASVTVYPVLLAGRPSPEAAQAMGLLLERAGLRRIELAESAFVASPGVGLATEAAAFGEFVEGHPMATDYALFASFVGTPGVGVDEVRIVVADRTGAVVLSDSQGPEDAAFARAAPRNPMECALLAVERLRRPLHLEDPARAGVHQGAMAERMRVASGMPDETERAAMAKRLEALREHGAAADAVVYPVRTGADYSADDASARARAITARRLLEARAADRTVPFVAESSPNQQRTLWSGAASLREHLRRNAPDAGYAVFADYLMSGERVWGVHLYVCDRAGELVLVDFQNSHHDDFQAVSPESNADCGELVLRRLAALLR